MKYRQLYLLPKAKGALEQVGENIKLARLRRKLSESQVAERAGVSRSTLVLVEKGVATVRIGAYVQILFVLGLEKDLSEVARDDAFGRKLQDAEIITKQRAPKRK
ncbi:MAG: helix-turn-helix domain-containing protein [Flavobacteriales bacterium]|nr:helix-turn-helix domain-containing protein [Flavobacteriales bacterium]